jgi:ABC-type transport system substrate-binding protein
VQKQLADVGVDMQLVPVKDTREWVDRMRTGNFDAFLFEMYGRSLSWVYQLWHSNSGELNSGYRSADNALERLRSSRSDDEIRAAIAELTRVMHDDPPAAFLAWQTTTRAVSNRFDVRSENDRDIFANVWQWRPAGAGEQADR